MTAAKPLDERGGATPPRVGAKGIARGRRGGAQVFQAGAARRLPDGRAPEGAFESSPGERGAEEAEKNTPEDVAKQSYEALMAGKDRVYAASSLGTKLQGMTARFMPESVKAALHEKMAEHGSRGR